MARPRRTLPARRPSHAMDDSLLVRSAESLGRMIGTLQRQLDAARHVAARESDVRPRANGPAPAAARRAVAPKAAPRKRKNTRQAKAAKARVKKTTAAPRAGTKRRSARATRHA